MHTVSPALVIVLDDMLADDRPLLEVLRRKGVVLLDLMLNARAETVEGPDPGRLVDLHIIVGTGKIVGGRIVRIGVKVGENKVNVDGMVAAVRGAEGSIVVTGVGNAGLDKGIEV